MFSFFLYIVLKIGFPCSGETSGIGYGKVVLRLSRLPNTIEIAPGYDVQKELGLAFEIEKDCRKSKSYVILNLHRFIYSDICLLFASLFGEG